MPDTTPIIEFQNVVKSWGDHTVLNGLNFTVDPGEKVSIIGPSGSGKTTILRILMTLERPTSGTVLVGGRPLWDETEIARKRESARLRQIRRQIGMVFQSFNLFPHMTAVENVMEAPLRSLRLSRSEAEERARELLSQVGLANHLNHKPAQLSGGQQQRVAIARALAMRPQILLFDEPTSALDPELIGEVLNVIRTIASTTDITMLMVTHEMKFAQEISDRVVMFDQGCVVEEGAPDQFFTDPRQERTRRFLTVVRGA